MHIERAEIQVRPIQAGGKMHELDIIALKARPFKRCQCLCPVCNKPCVRDGFKQERESEWRASNLNGIPVIIQYRPQRILCKEHGDLNEKLPWTDGTTRFTAAFNDEVAWLVGKLPKTAIAEYLTINWRTVGSCVQASHDRLEPDVSVRIHDNVRRLCVDETSYQKGHKYITVIVNHDTNTVVWAAEGHGKAVLESFYRQLSKEQLASIKVVTGDGAKWITDCVNEFTPDCERCVDQFHVVQWAMDALDEVRREVWNDAYDEVKRLKKEHPRKPGRPKEDDPVTEEIREAIAKADEIKNSAYALGKAPEHLTEKQELRVQMIATNNDRLYRAYRMKEMLRLLLKSKDVDEAEENLKHWLWWASHSRIPAFKVLYEKIKRHKEHILNAIRLGMSNARIEATNNKIKLIIRKAYGFRNIQNMLDMVYLVCSDLRVPLPNRKPKAARSA